MKLPTTVLGVDMVVRLNLFAQSMFLCHITGTLFANVRTTGMRLYILCNE
jgi:hypothetical protein